MRPGALTFTEAVTCGEARARHDEPRVPRRERDGDTRADDGPRARCELDPVARSQVEAGVSRVGLWAASRRAHARDRDLRGRNGRHLHYAARRGCPRRACDEIWREATHLAVRQPCADDDARLGVRPLVDRRAERVEIGRGRAPSSYGTSRRTSSNRSAKRSAMRAFSSSRPSPVDGRDLDRVREPVRDAPPPRAR